MVATRHDFAHVDVDYGTVKSVIYESGEKVWYEFAVYNQDGLLHESSNQYVHDIPALRDGLSYWLGEL